VSSLIDIFGAMEAVASIVDFLPREVATTFSSLKTPADQDLTRFSKWSIRTPTSTARARHDPSNSARAIALLTNHVPAIWFASSATTSSRLRRFQDAMERLVAILSE